MNSAGVYSTGAISVTGTTFKSTGAEMAVIEGANSITLNNVNMTGTFQKWGVMIYQSMSGDASGTQGTFSMTGGSLNYTPTSGPLFYVNNSTGIINLKGAALTTGSGVLVSAAAGSWGNTGSNGGNVVLTGDGQTLTGDMTADSISTIVVTLKNSSALNGKLTKVSLTLDAASTWSLTGNSVLTSLVDSAGILGSAIANIEGNGYTVTYDASLSANSYLGGKTYTLVNGGTLAPAGSSSSVTTPAIATGGVVNAASGVAGLAPGAWVSIFGTNLATAAVSASASDMVNNSYPTTLGGTTVVINGKKAFLLYVSQVQVNVQAPDDSATGNITVAVTNSAGTASATVAMQPVMPALFVTSNYVLAVRPKDSTIINGTGSPAAGYSTAAAANPCDTLEIFGTGFGPTSPAQSAGALISTAVPTSNACTVAIGETQAAVLYCGLVGTGLYQANITVPSSLSTGTYPVVLTVAGVSSPSTATLKIATN
jgi:uncharacterized protein (TIGR03437 family)